MPLSGKWLGFAIIVLALSFAFLCRTCWRMLRQPKPGRELKIRDHFTLAGIVFSTLAVGSLLVLHLSWVSVTVSQHFGDSGIKILALFLFWPTLAGLLFSAAESGRIRFLGIGTSLITGFWWFSLSTVAAISMGAPIARHPAKFLIPEDYVGWVEVKYGEMSAPALQLNNGTFRYQIPDSGLLSTSSPLEEGWAKDEYFYYSKDGALHGLKETGWGFGGMIWGNTNEWQQSPSGSKPKQVAAYFYVGTEEQYHRAESRNGRRPFDESKSDKIPQ
jgi:hypothetical protein